MKLMRRCLDVLGAFVTWATVAFAVLWFYDWVSRWYVVVTAMLVIVGVAMALDRVKTDTAAPGSAPKAPVLPAPRDGETAELAWPAMPASERKIA